MIAICPSQEQLKSLSLGQLSEEQSDQMLVHLRGCESCQEEIGSIDTCEDTFVGSLRTVSNDDQNEFMQEDEFRLASARALAALATLEVDSDESLPSEIPKTIGEYEIVRSLGRGGMGHVYLGRHTKLGRMVAIKFIADHRRWDQTMHDRFASEMRMIGGLNHPNIVHAHDARDVDGVAVLVTEYIDGLDVSEIVKRNGRLSVADASSITIEICRALEYIDSQGLVHRDIKPSNIMLDKNGGVKLLDLGLARLQTSNGEFGEFTATGQAIGTADYVAPEQINDGRNVDIRADIYGLGCTMFKLLIGHAPFTGPEFSTTFAKMNAHVSEPAPSLAELRDDVPAELVQLVCQMLAKSPAERPPSIPAIIERLLPLVTGADLVQLVQHSSQLGEAHIPTQTIAKPPGSSGPKTKSGWFTRFPRTFAIAAGLFGILFGIWLGIIITIQRPDGKETIVEIPDGAVAVVDEVGNINIRLPGGKAMRIPRKSVTVHPQNGSKIATIDPGSEGAEFVTQMWELDPEWPVTDALEEGDYVDIMAVPKKVDGVFQTKGLQPLEKLISSRTSVRAIQSSGNKKTAVFRLSVDEQRQLAEASQAGYEQQIVSHKPFRKISDDVMRMKGVWRVVSMQSQDRELTEAVSDHVIMIFRDQFIFFRNGHVDQFTMDVYEHNGRNEIGFRKPDVTHSDMVRPGVDGSRYLQQGILYRFLKSGRLEIGLNADPETRPGSINEADAVFRLAKVESPTTDTQRKAFAIMRNSDNAKVPMAMYLACERVSLFEAPKELPSVSSFTEDVVEKTGQELIRSSIPIVTNKDVLESSVMVEGPSRRNILIKLTEEAGLRMGYATRNAQGKLIAVQLNGKIYQAPIIYSAVYNNLSISGDFTQKEAEQISKGIVPEINLTPKVNEGAGASRKASLENLKKLIIAMHNYHDIHNSLPASQNISKSGKKVSWRVAILPLLGHQELYDQYRFDQDWDSPDNSRLLNQMPDVYRHPTADKNSTTTDYVGFAGKETGLGIEQGVSLADFSDGLSRTGLLVEADTDIPWTKPLDFEFTRAALNGLRHLDEGTNVAMADGHVEFFAPDDFDAGDLESLLTRAGGEDKD